MPNRKSKVVALHPRAWSATAGEAASPRATRVHTHASARLRLARRATDIPWLALDDRQVGDDPYADLAHFRDLFERSPVGLLVMDLSGLVLRANATAQAMLQIQSARLVGTPLIAHCTAGTKSLFAEHLCLLAAGSELEYCEIDLIGATGSPRPICLATLNAGDGAEGPLRTALFDVSGLHEMETGLALAASVVEHTSEAVIVTDAERRIIALNPAFTQITGYAAREVLGQLPTVFQPDLGNNELEHRIMTALRERGHWQGEVRSRHKSGKPYVGWISVSEIRDDSGDVAHYVCMLSDMTPQEEAKTQLFQLAYFDSLTGLPNRANFLDQLSRALIDAKQDKRLLGVLYLDLDHFKDVNDTMGHSVGDRLLQFVAKELKESVRQTDVVARLGGDELAILFHDLKRPQAAGQIATNILNRFEETPFHVDGREIYASVSIGIALYPRDAQDSQSLIDCADAAMYSAKSAGRNGFRFHSTALGQSYRNGHAQESDLRGALDRNELSLLYQPQVSLRTFQILGCETFLCWNRPGKGPVELEASLPLARKTECIVECERWAFDALISQVEDSKRLIASALTYSIDVSSLHLRPAHFERLATRLAETADELRSALELEIREADLLDCPSRTLDALQRMRDLGIPLMLDQMGLGPTFLRQLKKLPFRRVKLDRSLILDLETNSESETVVAAIIALAHTCGLAVIADGVETAGQMEILRSHGCDQAQGALFSPAVPIETLEGLLAQALPPLSEECGDPKAQVPVGRVATLMRRLAQACLPKRVTPCLDSERTQRNKLGN